MISAFFLLPTKRTLKIASTWALLLSMLSPVYAAQQAPYIYYYSPKTNAFVIERADGTDSQTFGKGIMPSSHDDVTEASWSPSGHWLAWMSNKLESGEITETSPFVLNRDGKTRLTLLDHIKNIEALQWSPTRDIVLAWANEIDWTAGHSYIHIYLIDVQAQKILTTVTKQSETSYDEAQLTWSADGQRVRFTYEPEQDGIAMDDVYLLTLSLDGKTEARRIAIPTALYLDEQWWPGKFWSAYLTGTGNTLNIERSNNADQALQLSLPETSPNHIDWDPDGIHAFVFAGEDLWLLTLPNGTFSHVSEQVGLPYQDDSKNFIGFQSWSPDGRYGLFLTQDHTLHLFDVKSMSDSQLKLPSLNDNSYNGEVIWYPDSQQFLVEWGTFQNRQLYRYDLASQKATLIGPTTNGLFGISQDGHYLAAYDCTSDIIGTCIMTPNGQRTLITPYPGIVGDYPGSYRFHPTQAWVIIQEGNETSSGSLFTVASLDGAVQRHITSCSFSGTCIGWLPDVAN